MPPSGSGGGGVTNAVQGTDYTIDGSNNFVVSVGAYVNLGMYFADPGNVLHTALEWPAINARLVTDVSGSAISGAQVLDWFVQLFTNTSGSDGLSGNPHTHTGTYTGTNFAVGMSEDATSLILLNGAKFRLELDVTFTVPTKWGGFAECFEDTE